MWLLISDHDHPESLRISKDSCRKGSDKLNDKCSPVDSFTLSSSDSQDWLWLKPVSHKVKQLGSGMGIQWVSRGLLIEVLGSWG